MHEDKAWYIEDIANCVKMIVQKIKKYSRIILGFLIMGLICFEVYLRIVHFSYNSPFFEEDVPFINRENVKACGLYQFDFFLFWKYRPGARGQINSFGFRDHEFRVAKKSQFRIVVLGDSCTAGHQLPTEKTYSTLLEKLLNNETGIKTFEVINAGVPGYTSFQGLRYFRIITNKYNPDLVIVCYGTNDRSKARYADKELSYVKLLELCLIRLTGEHIRIAQFMMKKMSNVDTLRWGTRVMPEDYMENLKTIAKEAREKNIRLIFIKPCLKRELEMLMENNLYALPQPYVNLYKVFSLYTGEESGKVFFDSLHFTELGHKLLANEIYSQLINFQIIKLDNKVVNL